MFNQNVIDFIENHRVGVLAVALSDGTPHAATLHYSSQVERPSFFFSVDRNSRKCRDMVPDKRVGASLVIGFDETEMVTFQADGLVQVRWFQSRRSRIIITLLLRGPDKEQDRTPGRPVQEISR